MAAANPAGGSSGITCRPCQLPDDFVQIMEVINAAAIVYAPALTRTHPCFIRTAGLGTGADGRAVPVLLLATGTRGVIPDDAWAEPYMPEDELRGDIEEAGITFCEHTDMALHSC